MKSRGDRRPKADVDRDAVKIALLVCAGKSAREAGVELGLPETTARRLAKRGLTLLPKPQDKSVVAVQPVATPAPIRVETFRQKQHRLQMEENGGKLHFRPEAAARRRRIERLGFDDTPESF